MDIEQQVALFMQGTEYGDDNLTNAMRGELLERLKEGRPLKVYCGFDPTSSDLHLGHTIPMRKLRQFQDMGHDVIFLIGDYTSLIGDPSDKDKLRPILTPEEVKKNGKTYAAQAFRILDENKTMIEYNSKWLSKLMFGDLIDLGSNFTIQQFLTRENFRKRWDKGDPVFLHETFYAIMQGYDAYMLDADVQVGGTDQLFNIITAARKLMTAKNKKPNIGIIMGILPGTDGEIRMSKTLKNHIPINSSAEDMFGKVMSIPDKAMSIYFKLVTRLLPEEIEKIEAGLKNGIDHPKDVKMDLAYEITDIFYGKEGAEAGRADFIKRFQQGGMPDNIPDYDIKGDMTVLDVLVDGGLVRSRGEGRRMIDQKGVRLDGETLTDPTAKFPHPGVLQVGKHKYLQVK